MRKALAVWLAGAILLAGCGGVAGTGPSPEPLAGAPAAAGGASGESVPAAAADRGAPAGRSEAGAPPAGSQSATGDPQGASVGAHGVTPASAPAPGPGNAEAGHPVAADGGANRAPEVRVMPIVNPPGERLPGLEPPGLRTPVPVPADPTPPGEAEPPADPLPERLRGFAEDEVLRLEVVAERQESGLYRVAATLTNMGGAGVDLVFDCGSLLHLRYPGRALRPDPARMCPAVYSRLFEAGATEQLGTVFDPREQGLPQIAVVYGARSVGSARAELRAVLEPADED